MTPIVLAGLVAALSACGLALGLSTTDAVDLAVARHAASIEHAVSGYDPAFPTTPGAPIPNRGRPLPFPCEE